MSRKIACVIPSYNHAEYIAEAIRSVVRQTLPPERLVIVDDGSQELMCDAAGALYTYRKLICERAQSNGSLMR